ncbi:hypothetical protein JCM11251_004493 [Rhodosporidiobolus azoricus]
MASASPPPPPDPNRPGNPFRTSCSSSSPARPALRRSKTLANPESPTTWRREPLVDVTNAVLGREHLGRLQRVPLDGNLQPFPSTDDDISTSPLPATPSSRIPRRALRRTRSAAPTMGGGGPGPSSSPSGGGNVTFAPSALPGDGLASPPRELRPRLPRPAGGLGAGAAGSRRTRSASFGGGSGGGSSAASGSSSLLPPVPSTSTATPSRRRTFGGVSLAAVLEDPEDTAVTASSSAAPSPTPTPRTRSRARGLDEGEGGEDGAGGHGTSENERRLRRRRTTGSAPSTPSSTRRGLR